MTARLGQGSRFGLDIELLALFLVFCLTLLSFQLTPPVPLGGPARHQWGPSVLGSFVLGTALGGSRAFAEGLDFPQYPELVRVGLEVAAKWEVTPQFNHVIVERNAVGSAPGGNGSGSGSTIESGSGDSCSAPEGTNGGQGAARVVARAGAGEKWSVSLNGTVVTLKSGSGSIVAAKPPFRFEPSGTDGGGSTSNGGSPPAQSPSNGGSPPSGSTSNGGLRISLNGRRYRGTAEFIAVSGGLQAVNELPVEEYLYGVVPREMPPSWPPEALKAQAVAARTYLLFIRDSGKYASQGYDVRATQDDQVYGGLDGEDPRTNRAVDETLGEVICYQGRPIQAFFHSSSGGHTEDSATVWGSPIPYLRGVADFDQDSPHYDWTETVSMDKLSEILISQRLISSPLTGIALGVQRGVSGRPSTVVLQSRTGSKEVRANSFRLAVGLKSTLMELTKLDERLAEVTARYGGNVTDFSAGNDGARTGTDDKVAKSGAQGSGPNGSRVVWVMDGDGFAREREAAGLVAVDGNGRLYRLTNFTALGISRVPGAIQFKGRGMGHGVGMSQWGAKALAEKKGYDYQRILRYYYSGVDLVRFSIASWDSPSSITGRMTMGLKERNGSIAPGIPPGHW